MGAASAIFRLDFEAVQCGNFLFITLLYIIILIFVILDLSTCSKENNKYDEKMSLKFYAKEKNTYIFLPENLIILH